MSLIEFINESVDPFLMQLVIVPFIVVGCGVLFSILIKKVIIAPIITLILNILYERCFFGLHKADLGLSSWNVIFPIIALIISLIISFLKSLKINTNSPNIK